MAAIEKICEYSGDYPGRDMYDYKKNHIQIMPEYRKFFKNKKATLIFIKKPYQERFIFKENKPNHNKIFSVLNYYINYLPLDSFLNEVYNEDNIYFNQSINSQLYREVIFKNNYQLCKIKRIAPFKEYYLVVHDELPNSKTNIFYNMSYKISTVIRKMKKLTSVHLEVKHLTQLQYQEYINTL